MPEGRREAQLPAHGALEYAADGLRAAGLLGVIAAVIWWSITDAGVLAHAQIVPAPGRPGFTPRVAIALVSTLGLALSALWEMVEWVGYAFISNEIYVAYVDTIGDMAMGGLGAVVAGVVVARARLLRADALP